MPSTRLPFTLDHEPHDAYSQWQRAHSDAAASAPWRDESFDAPEHAGAHRSGSSSASSRAESFHADAMEHAGPSSSGATLSTGGTASSSERRVFARWRPEDRYSMSSESDSTIRRGARAHVVAHGIPASNVFVLPREAPSSDGGEPLGELTLASRLDLQGHGTSRAFESLSSRRLAQRLQDQGLAQVGVLKLQSCDPGKTDFLECLRAELDALGIQVGYLSGAKGVMKDVRHPVKLGRLEFNVNPFLVIGAFNKSGGSTPWRSQTSMLKTVKGNVDIAFSGTRYDLPDSIGAKERAVFGDLDALDSQARFDRLHGFLHQLPSDLRRETARQLGQALRTHRDEFSTEQRHRLVRVALRTVDTHPDLPRAASRMVIDAVTDALAGAPST